MTSLTITPAEPAVYRRVLTSHGDVFCAIIGDPNGTPVVAYHGIGNNAPSFAIKLQGLAKATGWRIYAIALPNHSGGSKIRRFGYSAEEFRDLLIEVIIALGLTKVPMLIGHSMGGQLAVLVANSRPDLVAKRIFLIDPAVGEDWDAKSLSCIRKPWLLLKLAMELGYDAANEAMGSIYHLKHLVSSLGDALTTTSPNLYRRIQATVAVMSTRNTAGALKHLTEQGFEIFIAHGTKDTATPSPKWSPGCTILEVEGGFHSWFEDDPLGLAKVFGPLLGSAPHQIAT